MTAEMGSKLISPLGQHYLCQLHYNFQREQREVFLGKDFVCVWLICNASFVSLLWINQEDNLNDLQTKYIKNQLEIYQKYTWNMMGKNGNGERIQKHFCINLTIGLSHSPILHLIFSPTAMYLHKINFVFLWFPWFL